MTKSTNSKRHYYAAYCPYGIRTISDADYALQFDSARERDAWVSNDTFEGDYHKEAVTLREIRRRGLAIHRHSDFLTGELSISYPPEYV